MTRKLIATGIAVVVAIPLIPVLEKGIGHLTGTDQPMVYPAKGWHQVVIMDTTLSAMPLKVPRIDPEYLRALLEPYQTKSLPENRFGVFQCDRWIKTSVWVRDALVASDLMLPPFTNADSGMNHGVPSGFLGGLQIRWEARPSEFAGVAVGISTVTERQIMPSSLIASIHGLQRVRTSLGVFQTRQRRTFQESH